MMYVGPAAMPQPSSTAGQPCVSLRRSNTNLHRISLPTRLWALKVGHRVQRTAHHEFDIARDPGLLGAVPAASHCDIWQSKKVQASKQLKKEWQQWRVSQPQRGLTRIQRPDYEVGNYVHRKSDGYPAVTLPNPVVPIHCDLGECGRAITWITFHPLPDGSRKPASTVP